MFLEETLDLRFVVGQLLRRDSDDVLKDQSSDETHGADVGVGSDGDDGGDES